MPDPSAKQKSLPTLAAELKDLVVTYVKQETIAPIKGLGRYIAFGMAGSVSVAVGLLLLSLALLRALQVETGTVFAGRFSWAPYVITLIACLFVVVLAVRAIRKPRRGGKKGPRREEQA